ncbi:MAG TPA: SH3 domain-containing protein [Smithellaceae bacterium]|nr:SH3 domain-containing protein [Smithellaceae bacterium]
MMNACRFWLLLLFLLFLPAVASAAEKGNALKDDILRAEPYSDAEKTGDLQRGEKLEIIGKKGAWLHVKTAAAEGWTRLLSVKRGTAQSGSAIKGVLDVASGRAGTGKVVATTGVRGLNEEELKNARYNESAVKKMESYTQTVQQGRRFAHEGGLQAVQFDYLPEAGQEGEK